MYRPKPYRVLVSGSDDAPEHAAKKAVLRNAQRLANETGAWTGAEKWMPSIGDWCLFQTFYPDGYEDEPEHVAAHAALVAKGYDAKDLIGPRDMPVKAGD